MLSRELMGIALLTLAWVTALMVAIDALIDARAMWRRLAEWKTTLVQGTVVAPELAVHEVEQRVKQLDSDAPALVFFDRKHQSTVTGGAVTVGSEQLEVSGTRDAEVWIGEATRLAAAACSAPSAFDAMYASAQGGGGGLRSVRTSLRAGAPVWLVGTKQGTKFEARLVAGFDPRSWVQGRLTASLGIVVMSLLWVSAGTVLALWPPAFGLVSIGGALVLVGHFLGMTPIAMAAREKSRTPAFGFIRGTWKRDGGGAAAMTPATR